MTRDSSGSQNQPQYSSSGASSQAADLSEVANYAALVGNRKRGTSTQRTALTGNDVWDGLEFYETDTGLLYAYTTIGTTGWKMASAPGLLRERISWVNTGYIGGGATQATITIPAQAFVQRVMIDVDGFVSPQSAGDAGLTISVVGGTLVKNPGSQERIYAATGSQFYGYKQDAYVDLPANTATTITVKNVSSVLSAFQVAVRTRVLVSGEF